MHTQTVLNNTKLLRKAFKWSWFFSQLCLFCVCVCSHVEHGENKLFLYSGSPFCVCLTHHAGSAPRSRTGTAPGASALAQLRTLPGSLVRPRQENVALCGVFLWSPSAYHTSVNRFLATHTNAEPFPSIRKKQNFCLTEAIQSVLISSNVLTVSTFLKGKNQVFQYGKVII